MNLLIEEINYVRNALNGSDSQNDSKLIFLNLWKSMLLEFFKYPNIIYPVFVFGYIIENFITKGKADKDKYVWHNNSSDLKVN